MYTRGCFEHPRGAVVVAGFGEGGVFVFGGVVFCGSDFDRAVAEIGGRRKRNGRPPQKQKKSKSGPPRNLIRGANDAPPSYSGQAEGRGVCGLPLRRTELGRNPATIPPLRPANGAGLRSG